MSFNSIAKRDKNLERLEVEDVYLLFSCGFKDCMELMRPPAPKKLPDKLHKQKTNIHMMYRSYPLFPLLPFGLTKHINTINPIYSCNPKVSAFVIEVNQMSFVPSVCLLL